MRLLFTGSRNRSNFLRKVAIELVDNVLRSGKYTEIVVGDAWGIDADVIARVDEINKDHILIPIKVFGAYGKVRERTSTGENIALDCSYPERDYHMVFMCDECVALWNGISNGCRITFKAAEALGKKVYIIKDEN